MARGKRSSRLPSVEDVLSGKRSPTVADLVALIHRVNPTGRGLPPHQEDRRYATKSQLQSVLIRQHSEHLSVRAADEDGDLVLIQPRTGGQDGGHALISGLDEDVRTWVREQLAMGGSDESASATAPSSDPAPPRRPKPAPISRDDLVAQGREAFEAYDYEQAESLLRRAVREHPGDVEAATLLFELLVDHLACWADAYALADTLRNPAAGEPAVRERLARAAARTGNPQEALRLARDLDDTFLAPVLALVAEAELRENRHLAAEESLQRLREIDPYHAPLARLEQELARVRAEARAPEERALQRLHDAEEWGALYREAETFLQRWPGSTRARDLLAHARQELQRRERAEALSELREAIHREDVPRARRLRERLDSSGGTPRKLVKRLDEVQERLRRAEERAREESVARQLRDGPLHEALLAWLRLPPASRERLRREQDRPEPGWLAAIDPPTQGRRAHRVVEAVLALAAAHHQHRQGDSSGALHRLESHWGLIGDLDDARALRDRARQDLERHRRQTFDRVTDRVEATLANGEAERALALLDEAPDSAFPREDRNAAGELRARIQRRIERDLRLREAREHAENGRWLQFRESLRTLAGSSGSVEDLPEDLQAILPDLDERVLRQFQVEVMEQPDIKLYDWKLPEIDFRESRIVLPGGERFITVRVVAGHLVARWVQIDSGQVSRLLVLKVPDDIVVVDCQIEAGEVWCIGRRGEQLRVRLEDGMVLSLRGPLPSCLGGELVCNGMVIPGTHWLWLTLKSQSSRDPSEQTGVCRAGESRIYRKLAIDSFATVVFGSDPPRILVTEYGVRNRLYLPRGTPDSSFRYPPPMTGESMAAVGSGWASLRREDAPIAAIGAPAGPEEELVLAYHEPGGAILSEERLQGSSTDAVANVFYLKRCERLFTVYGAAVAAERWLAAYTITEDGSLERKWETVLPPDIAILTDEAIERGWVGVATAEGFHLYELGVEPPVCPLPGFAGLDDLRMMEMMGFNCKASLKTDRIPDHSVQEEVTRIASLPPNAAREAIESFEERYSSDPEALVCLVHGISMARAHSFHDEVLERASNRNPRHCVLSLLQAAELAKRARWAEVHELLEQAGHESLDDSNRAHHHHLRGLAWLHLNNLDEADRELDMAVQVGQGTCDLDKVQRLVEFLLLPITRLEDLGATYPIAEQIARIRRCDEHLEAGRPEQAIAALDHPLLWKYSELQSSARRAYAWLQLEPRPLDQRVSKRIALTAHARLGAPIQSYLAYSVPYAPNTWSSERVEEVGYQALDWLGVDSISLFE